MDAIEAMRTRRSIRSYKDTPVPRADIEEVVDCGRLAASARNVQPWEFIVITDTAMRKQIAAVADTGRFIADAPVCIVVLCADTKYYLEDGSAATQNILVAARAKGLGTCWVAGDKKPYADEILRIVGAPGGAKLISLIALGYANSTPEPGKRSLTDVLHWERF